MASVLDAFGEAFRLTSESYRLFFIPTLALVIMQFAAYGVQYLIEESFTFALLPIAAVIGFFGAAAQVWMFSRALAVVTGKKHVFRWSAALALWGYLILVGLMVQAVAFLAGMSLLMVLGALPMIILVILAWQALLVYVLVRFVWFIPEIASDKREKDAFERTYQLTAGHFWQVVFFMLISTAVALAGLVALGIGVLFAIPMTAVASIHYYEQLRKEYRKEHKAAA